jgi:formylglycine-generating enzyme required for sulfatase activity/tRNA A-37 threonylcarbamoyl transferase component Bud32
LQKPGNLPPRLGRFEIRQRLGAGAFGTVYRAWDPVLEREVALKVPQAGTMETESARQRFLREAKSAGQLRHPHIVPVYDAGSHGGQFYIASAFVAGHTLAAEMENGPLDQRRAAAIVMKLADALQYAHEQGIVHRDIKPANVMLDPKGEPHLMDFGLAAWDESKEKLTLDGTVLGTPAYMSPEQAGEPGFAVGSLSDQYSLGVVLYELLTGQRPFSGPLAALLYQIRKADPPAPHTLAPTLPRDLDTICLKAIVKRPSERFGNCRLLADDLRRWLDGEPIHARQMNLAERAVRWARRNPLVASLSAAVVLVTLVGLVLITWQWHRAQTNLAAMRLAEQERAAAQVDALLRADINQVPSLLENLAPIRAQVLPRLKERMTQSDLDDGERLRLSLALLPNDPAQVPLLRDRLLVAPPDELLVVRNALAPHADQLKTQYWTTALDPQTEDGKRFRAACVLAGFDPQGSQWDEVRDDVVNTLVGENPLLAARWIEALRPVKDHLVAPLVSTFRDPDRPESDRALTTNILADYAAERPDTLAQLIADADQKQFAVLFPKLTLHGSAAAVLLEQQLATPAAGGASWEEKDKLAQRQANAAAALLRVSKADKVWPLLAHSTDPSPRSWLIHRVAPRGVDPQVLITRLDEEPDVSVRRALLLCLGEYDDQTLDAGTRGSLVPKLLDLYRDDPDPGLHGAAEWLLRRWDQQAAIGAADKQLARGKPEGNRAWYVNGQGQTMVVISGPVEFQMGSPASEPNRESDETLHARRIARSFAIAAKPVTVEQYLAFLGENPTVPRVADEYVERYSPEGDCPMTAVIWYEAAAYCNWLSKKEGIPENQWCYQPNAAGNFEEGMKPAADFLTLVGYRLPTEAEWEYACRAGTVTSRYYGQSDQLLANYAWHLQNSQDRTWPVGLVKPNDLGLFEVHGNVWQWCHDRHASYATADPSSAADDRADTATVTDNESRVLRGGSFGDAARNVRSAYRNANHPVNRNYITGFRVARTYN